MKFVAEIVEIKQVKSVSNDKVFTLKLRTEDNRIMALSAYPSEEVVQVDIKGEHE